MATHYVASQFVGVYRSKHGFRARIRVGQRRINSGVFPTALDAAKQHDYMMRKHFGDAAHRLNFERTPQNEKKS